MPLVYDIGLHDGGDTRQYLKEGCRVIAVDANPAMCVAAARELEQEIEAGRLTILNRGIAERAGTARFWICDDVSEWSSFHRSIASRNGVTHHAIDVECVTIQEIIGQYGVPLYMKIDIEGNDKHCIAGLSTDMRPRYVSIEMDHEAGHREIRQLHSLGYRRFKIICQNNHWNQVTLSNLWFYRLGPESPFTTRLQRIDALAKRITGRQRLLEGRKIGESGPWGERTQGRWHSFRYALYIWAALHEIDKRANTHGLGWWFDVHAKL